MSGCTGKLKAKFILNFASPCNINYHKILGTEIKTYTYTEEQLLRYSEYIKYILNNNKDFYLDLEKTMLPNEMNGDGFYAAIIKRR